MTRGDRHAPSHPPGTLLDVREGQDGWLILTVGSNDVVGQFQRFGDLGETPDPPRGEPLRRFFHIEDAVRACPSTVVLARGAAGLAGTLHVGPHVVSANDEPGADPCRLMLFGESRARFGPVVPTAMPPETFAEGTSTGRRRSIGPMARRPSPA